MQRLVTALVLAPIAVAAVLFLPSLAFLLVLSLVMAGAAEELRRLGRVWAPQAPLWLLPVLVPATVVAVAATLHGDLGSVILVAGLSTLVVVVALVVLVARTPTSQSVPALGTLGFGTVYLALPAVSLWLLQQRDPWLAFLVLAVVAFSDTFAFYGGRAFGRHPLSPQVSPKKTWEGAAAGLLAGILVTALWSIWRLGAVELGLLLVGTSVAAAAQCGDLVESMLKRGAGVKDSGALLPGHGGVLDRVDGLLFAAPVLLLGMSVLELAGQAR